jgi:hypothetical protein
MSKHTKAELEDGWKRAGKEARRYFFMLPPHRGKGVAGGFGLAQMKHEGETYYVDNNGIWWRHVIIDGHNMREPA